jgi:AraC-like DNA-binding protein
VSDPARSVGTMQSATTLAARPEFSVTAVTCRAGREHRWSPPEEHCGHRLVLVCGGRFQRWADGRADDLDRTTAYISSPGQEERFAHPAGGDECTSIEFSPESWPLLPPGTAVYVDARVDLAHRRLLMASAAGDPDYAVAEELVRLAAAAVGGLRDPAIGPADRATVAAAREAILADIPEAAGLLPLARLLAVSPYRLSRVFSRETGVSLTHYRNRVRVGRAVDRLAAGHTALADLATDLGFADQAHLTRTVREHVGHTPSALRRLLASAGVPAGHPAVQILVPADGDPRLGREPSNQVRERMTKNNSRALR